MKNKFSLEKNSSLSRQDFSRKLSKGSMKFEEKFDKFNTPMNNILCSQLLQSVMNNEKQLILIPYAKKKEKINKTFNTIGNSNGISYYEYRVIKGNEKDKNNIFNIIREDNRKSLSKMKEYSEISSIRKSNFSNYNKFIDNNLNLNNNL